MFNHLSRFALLVSCSPEKLANDFAKYQSDQAICSKYFMSMEQEAGALYVLCTTVKNWLQPLFTFFSAHWHTEWTEQKIAIDEKMQETESSTNRGDITSCNIIDTFKKSYQIPNGIDNGSLVVNASINLVNILEISEKKQQVDDLFQMYQHFYNLYCSTTLFFYYI